MNQLYLLFVFLIYFFVSPNNVQSGDTNIYQGWIRVNFYTSPVSQAMKTMYLQIIIIFTKDTPQPPQYLSYPTAGLAQTPMILPTGSRLKYTYTSYQKYIKYFNHSLNTAIPGEYPWTRTRPNFASLIRQDETCDICSKVQSVSALLIPLWSVTASILESLLTPNLPGKRTSKELLTKAVPASHHYEY